MKKRQWILVISGLALIVVSIVLAGYFAEMKPPPEKELVTAKKKFVRTRTVSYEDQPTSILAYGRVKSAKSLDLVAEVSGRMYEGSISLKEGEVFKKGALIYYIDDTEVRLNVNASKSDFLRDLATILPDLKIDFTESYASWSTYFNAIKLEESLPALPSPRTTKEKTFLATKSIFSSYYKIKSAEANLRKYRFYAPFAASVSSLELESGSFVNPGNKIGKIVLMEELELKVDVNLNDISWVKIGAETTISDEKGANTWKGEVVRIGKVVNQQTQSVNVYLNIVQNENLLLDGNYLQAEIPGMPIEEAMLVNRNALFEGGKVYVLEDTLLKVKTVKVHRINAETVIVSGLAIGADLVVEPLVDAHNNMTAFKVEEKSSPMDASLSKK